MISLTFLVWNFFEDILHVDRLCLNVRDFWNTANNRAGLQAWIKHIIVYPSTLQVLQLHKSVSLLHRCGECFRPTSEREASRLQAEEGRSCRAVHSCSHRTYTCCPYKRSTIAQEGTARPFWVLKSNNGRKCSVVNRFCSIKNHWTASLSDNTRRTATEFQSQ